MTALGTLKGAAFREFLVWYSGAHGGAALADAVGRMPPHLRAELDTLRPALGVIASERYDAALVHALLDAIVAPLSVQEVDRLVVDAAEATIRRMMRGVQRVAFSLLVSPDRYPRIINTLWALTYDTGRVDVEVLDGRHHLGIVSGWRGHHEILCRVNHHAKRPIYEVMGCHDVIVEQTSCVSRGDPDCRSHVRWR